MAKAPSPLLGYNNNVRHKNRVFHIQTEDSGIKHPHIITHLFMDGGRILKSVKKSYADIVGSEGMADLVRAMMKDQHKQMFIALRDGQFDHLIEAAVNGVAPVHPSARPLPPPPPPEASVVAIPASTSSPDATDVTPGPPPMANMTIPAPPPSESVVGAPPSSAGPATTRESSPLSAATPASGDTPLQLDIDELPPMRPAFRSNHDLPPPPANLFKKPDTGRYRNMPREDAREEVVEQPPDVATPGASPATMRHPTGSHPAPSPPSAPRAPQPQAAAPAAPPAQQGYRHTPGYGSQGKMVPQPGRQQQQQPSPAAPPAAASSPSPRVPPPPASAPGPGEGRYAPARPAAIFGQARPQQGSSIFGEDLISDKSLDEVILSYLAEDLDGGDKK